MPLKSKKMSRKTARHKKKYANKYKFKNEKKKKKKRKRGTKCVKVIFFSHLKELTDYAVIEIVKNKLICLIQKNVLRGIRKQ